MLWVVVCVCMGIIMKGIAWVGIIFFFKIHLTNCYYLYFGGDKTIRQMTKCSHGIIKLIISCKIQGSPIGIARACLVLLDKNKFIRVVTSQSKCLPFAS